MTGASLRTIRPAPPDTIADLVAAAERVLVYLSDDRDEPEGPGQPYTTELAHAIAKVKGMKVVDAAIAEVDP
jgi:hypothetical protein